MNFIYKILILIFFYAISYQSANAEEINEKTSVLQKVKELVSSAALVEERVNLNITFFIVLLSTFYMAKLSGLKISGHSSVVERLVANEKVEGSTPFARSKKVYE